MPTEPQRQALLEVIMPTTAVSPEAAQLGMKLSQTPKAVQAAVDCRRNFAAAAGPGKGRNRQW